MLLVKVLERKWVIRCFGLALAVSPFVNIVLTMSLQMAAEKWTSYQFWKVVNAHSTVNNIMSVASIVIGLTMLSGSRRSWKFALALLGGYILLQVPRLGQDLRSSWIYGAFFLVNIVTFLFIADQLAFKQKKTAQAPQPVKPVQTAQVPQSVQAIQPVVEKKAEKIKLELKPDPVAEVKLDPQPVAKAESKPIPEQPLPKKPQVIEPIKMAEKQKAEPKWIIKTSRRRILISFQGDAPWAQLSGVSVRGVEMKSLRPPPADFADRKIELLIAPDVILKIKYTRHLENKFFFDYTEMNDAQMERLNTWLVQAPKAA